MSGFPPIKFNGNIQTYLFAIAKGEVPGHRMHYTHAVSPSIGTTQVLIWPLDFTPTFNDTATTLYLTSSDNTDTHFVQIDWLGADYKSTTSLIQLAGHTPVPIGVGLRVNRAFTVATTKTLGNVYVANANNHTLGIPNDNTEIVSYYSIATQTRSMALFTVPAGYTAFGVSGYFSAPKGRDNDFFWNVRNPNLPIPPINTNVVSVYQTTKEIDFAFTSIPEKTDAYFTANTTASTGRVSARIPTILVDNNFIDMV